jgi:hypothetical protein
MSASFDVPDGECSDLGVRQIVWDEVLYAGRGAASDAAFRTGLQAGSGSLAYACLLGWQLSRAGASWMMLCVRER